MFFYTIDTSLTIPNIGKYAPRRQFSFQLFDDAFVSSEAFRGLG